MPRNRPTLARAQSQYPHRYTCEHVPQWAREQRADGTYYAPQYKTDQEWYDNTIFPGEDGCTALKFCESSNPSWPLGVALKTAPL